MRRVSEDDPGRDWMLALRRGDTAAFDSIVLHYQESVRKFIGRYLADEARREDLAQEAFLRVYRARKRYEPTAKFRTWLFTIVTRLCLNELRSRSRQRRVFVSLHGSRGANENAGEDPFGSVADDQAETPQDRVERAELEDVLRQAIEQLPGKQRAAILLLRFESASYHEIAVALDVSTKAVKSLVNRARESLRQKLESYRDGKWRPRGPARVAGGGEPETALKGAPAAKRMVAKSTDGSKKDWKAS